MHKLRVFATILAIANVNKVLAECCSCKGGGNIPEYEWTPVPRVFINNLVVPSNVTPGSADAILDCDYGDADDREGLMVRWLYDNPDNPEELLSNLPRKKHLVYQWIPPHLPEAFGLLKNKVDLTYKVTPDPFAEHRAIRIPSPEPDMSGVYTCVVSTIHSKDERAKRMTVGGTSLEPNSKLLSSSKLFRHGYKYNNVTQAFYKLHLLKLEPWKAYQKCLSEGGTLAVPSNQEEIKQLTMMMQPVPDKEPVLVGDSNRTMSESDVEVCVMRFEEERGGYTFKDLVYHFGEIRRRPFVCKVEAKNVSFDEHCDPGYEYYDNIKSCYKLFTGSISWYDAYSECEGQDAHLLVLNSKAESETIKQYLRKIENVAYPISVGIREVQPVGRQRVFNTIFNDPLEEAGFNEWSPGEPSNWRRGASDPCGAINQYGEYNDIPCTYWNNFLCEKELHLGPNYRLPPQL